MVSATSARARSLINEYHTDMRRAADVDGVRLSANLKVLGAPIGSAFANARLTTQRIGYSSGGIVGGKRGTRGECRRPPRASWSTRVWAIDRFRFREIYEWTDAARPVLQAAPAAARACGTPRPPRPRSRSCRRSMSRTRPPEVGALRRVPVARALARVLGDGGRRRPRQVRL